MRRKHIKARIGPLRLWFDPKREKWTMTGGQWGEHSIYVPEVYNHRVDAHWRGYTSMNGHRVMAENMPKAGG